MREVNWKLWWRLKDGGTERLSSTNDRVIQDRLKILLVDPTVSTVEFTIVYNQQR